MWEPAPEEHNCTFVEGKTHGNYVYNQLYFLFMCAYLALITLELVDSDMVSSDIDCPGDTLTYNCSIESNSETLHLTWNITFPEEIPIDFTFNSTSILFTWYDWDIGVSAVLTGYIDQEYVKSTIIFTIMNDVILDGTELECSITDLGNEISILYINTSGMCVANHIIIIKLIIIVIIITTNKQTYKQTNNAQVLK